MKAVVLYAHPNSQSFNHAVLTVVREELERVGAELSVRDLYALGFDPVLKGGDLAAVRAGEPLEDVAREQEILSAADLLVVVHPIWWFGMPAVLKGYIDRVFSYGFAYTAGPEGPVGLLQGKKVAVFTSTGGSEDAYRSYGFEKALRTTMDQGIYGFCGMEVVLHQFFFAVPGVTSEQRNAMLDEMRLGLREKVLPPLV